MLRYARTTLRLPPARILLALALTACVGEDCDNPFGYNYQATFLGDVTLNGEPVPDVDVALGMNQAATDAQGRYNLRVQFNDEPYNGCPRLLTEPFAAVERATVFNTCSVSDGGSSRYDYAFVQPNPFVTIVSPADGAEFDEGESITLRSQRPAPVSLNGWSVTPGGLPIDAVWSSSIAGALATETFAAPPVTLAAGVHVVTATISDAFGATASDQVTVTVHAMGSQTNQQPTATITAPSNGTAFPPLSVIEFNGSSTDPEDGALTGSALAWTSSQEGAIGTGTFFARAMAAGSHIIVLTATDSQGATGADTIAIHINSATGTGSISGTVTIGGTPLTSVPVTLSGAASASTATGSAGEYAFTDLAAGGYTITISPPPGTDIGTVQMATLADGQSLTVNFVG